MCDFKAMQWGCVSFQKNLCAYFLLHLGNSIPCPANPPQPSSSSLESRISPHDFIVSLQQGSATFYEGGPQLVTQLTLLATDPPLLLPRAAIAP